MRSVVKNLWDSILNPLNTNDERMIDMVSFFTLILNGQITNEEIEEIMKGQ